MRILSIYFGLALSLAGSFAHAGGPSGEYFPGGAGFSTAGSYGVNNRTNQNFFDPDDTTFNRGGEEWSAWSTLKMDTVTIDDSSGAIDVAIQSLTIGVERPSAGEFFGFFVSFDENKSLGIGVTRVGGYGGMALSETLAVDGYAAIDQGSGFFAITGGSFLGLSFGGSISNYTDLGDVGIISSFSAQYRDMDLFAGNSGGAYSGENNEHSVELSVYGESQMDTLFQPFGEISIAQYTNDLASETAIYGLEVGAKIDIGGLGDLSGSLIYETIDPGGSAFPSNVDISNFGIHIGFEIKL